jgi:hypothetical protein
LHNKRLRQEYDKALRLIRAKEVAGKKGATNRWNKPKPNGGDSRNDGRPNGSAIGTAMAEPMPRQCAGNAIQNQIQNKKNQRKEEKTETTTIPPPVVRFENGSEIITPPKIDPVLAAWNGITGVVTVKYTSQPLSRAFNAACLRVLFCEKWQEGIEAVRRSEYCCGGGMNATFEWFLTEGNLEKLLNGNYGSTKIVARSKPAPPTTEDKIAAFRAKQEQQRDAI